MHTVFRLRWFC